MFSFEDGSAFGDAGAGSELYFETALTAEDAFQEGAAEEGGTVGLLLKTDLLVEGRKH